jgi:hypothetical protein
VFLVHILGKLLNHNLEQSVENSHSFIELTLVLLIGLGLLPRLGLRERLSVLYLPFRRGLRLIERGEMERRLERDLESGLALETSEYGDRVRGLPRDGDLEGMIMLMLKLNLQECGALMNARL